MLDHLIPDVLSAVTATEASPAVVGLVLALVVAASLVAWIVLGRGDPEDHRSDDWIF
jgi:hypothetical protein